MKLYYYNNVSDERYVDKNITLVKSPQQQHDYVNVEFLDDTSIVHPTFRLQDHLVYMTANYVYVEELRRYYFIRDITTSKGFAYIRCDVDVLMTYKEQLRERTCIVTRQEKHYNLYQNDNNWKIYNYTAKRTIPFNKTGGFDYNKQEFILGIIGDNS